MRKKQSRAKRLGLIAGIAAIAVFLSFALSCKLEVTQYSLTSPKITREVTLAVLSDLHNSFYGKDQIDLIAAVQDAEPDAVLLVGDMVEYSHKTAGMQALLQGLTNQYPVYYASGNHESDDDPDLFRIKQQIRALGAVILEGESVMLGEIRIAGTDDPQSLYRQEWRDQVDACRAKDDVYTVLMAHRPDRAEYYETGFDLIVSGHAHGGQVRIPGILDGLWAPNQGWFPKYTSGVYDVGEGKMSVSRGLCKNWVPRVFNRPEVVVLHILPQ